MEIPVSRLLKQAHDARRDNRLEDARRDLQEAIQQSRGGNMRMELIQSLKALGKVERQMGMLDSAGERYREAVQLSREEQEFPLLAHTLRHLADILVEQQRPEEAEAFLEEALQIYRREEQTFSLDRANALRSMALYQEKFGHPGRARDFWRQARELYQAVQLQEGVAECEIHLQGE